MIEKAELVRIIVDRLIRDSEELSERWNHPTGTRTRHVWIDDLLPDNIAHEIFAAFPKHAEGFFKLDSFREKKKTLADLSGLPPVLGAMTYALQDPAVIDAFSDITGMSGLVADPSLYAAGLSMMHQGDFLNPHIDNSHDGKRMMYRRLNFLYYATPDWREENGGNFEMWDLNVAHNKTVVSAFNRLLVMETNRTSWHSVSPVVAARPRCCVSTYVFAPESQDGDEYFHVTSFMGRPGQNVLRLFSRADNTMRQAAGAVLKAGRGRKRLNSSRKG